mgnify:CR=1 FL=1
MPQMYIGRFDSSKKSVKSKRGETLHVWSDQDRQLKNGGSLDLTGTTKPKEEKKKKDFVRLIQSHLIPKKSCDAPTRRAYIRIASRKTIMSCLIRSRFEDAQKCFKEKTNKQCMLTIL